MDASRAANSGHPGGAMSSADFASVLYSEFLNFDPDRATWFNRDRFVLSAGHESALLYGPAAPGPGSSTRTTWRASASWAAAPPPATRSTT